MPYRLHELLDQNRRWAEGVEASKPGFFTNLLAQQAPQYLWIGCADSRVPANEILGLLPGDVFVHRNVANVVVHSDLNALSVMQYAIDQLHVRHIMVVGHYGCGGVTAALHNRRVGLADNWIRHIQDVRDRYSTRLAAAPAAHQLDMLCELNVVEQVVNLCQSTVMKDAWMRDQELMVYGWIYGLNDGLLQDLGLNVQGQAALEPLREAAVEQVFGKNRLQPF